MKTFLIALTLVATTAAYAGDGYRYSSRHVRYDNETRTVRTVRGPEGGTARLVTHREDGRYHDSYDARLRLPNGSKATFETDRYRNPITGNVHRTWSVDGPNGGHKQGHYRRG